MNKSDFLPPLTYTIDNFYKWCMFLGHSPGLKLLDNFRIFCESDYCKTLKKAIQNNPKNIPSTGVKNEKT